MSEPISNHPQVKKWLSHIRTLAVDIGPRGSTTPEVRHLTGTNWRSYDKMNPQVMEDVWSLTMAMIQRIDQPP